MSNWRETTFVSIRYLREQLEDLEEYNRDILEYTDEQNTQLQAQNRLLLEYAEDSDSDSDNSDNEMTKKKDDTVLQDHMDEAQMKPIAIPTSVDVYEFKKALTNALAEVTSTKYIQGGGCTFLLETKAQYQIRERNPDAVYPTALIEPSKLYSAVKLTSDAYKLWKRHRTLYVEWNKYNHEALLLTDKKSPNMLDELKDPWLEAFPRGTMALEAFQSMEADLCSSDAQCRLTIELTKTMTRLAYTPNPLGPREYFRLLTNKYLHQINLLLATANVTSAQMIDYAHNTFEYSKYDLITLHRVEDDWKVYRETIAEDNEFGHYPKFWGRRLKELYSSYHTRTALANMTNRETWPMHASNSTPNLQNSNGGVHDDYTDVNCLKANQGGNQQHTPQPRSQRGPRRRRFQTEWKQYKHYCHSCGVNLSHDSCDCNRFKNNHQAGATFDNKIRGSTWNTEKWMKWSKPSSWATLLSILRDPLSKSQPRPTKSVTFLTTAAPSPGYGALDSAATNHFVPSTYQGGAPRDTPGALTVGCANGSTMQSTAIDIVDLPRLPPEAQQGCHKFDEGGGLGPRLMAVTGPSHNTVLEGRRDPLRDLYMVSLHQTGPKAGPKTNTDTNEDAAHSPRVMAESPKMGNGTSAAGLELVSPASLKRHNGLGEQANAIDTIYRIRGQNSRRRADGPNNNNNNTNN
eukprot:jgi/Psemu1/13578/gm1.13578_g